MIVDELIKLQQTKASIKQALIDKGQNPTDEFASYADNISNITSGGGGDPFLDIGYTTPDFIASSIQHSKDVANSWDGQSKFQAPNTLEYMPYIDLSNTTDASGMFQSCTKLQYVPKLTMPNLTNTSKMFYLCNTLKNLDISGFNTSKVTDMYQMFGSCSVLTSIKGLDNLDTSNVTNMGSVFSSCNTLPELNLSNWDVSNVTNMSWLFAHCDSVKKVDISMWDRSKVSDVGYMFNNLDNATEIDISNWGDMSGLTNVLNFFYNCPKLETLRMNNCDTSKITNMDYMFYTSVTKVEGVIDFSGVSRVPISFMRSMFYLTIKNIGKQGTLFNFSDYYYDNWGSENPQISGARQSLVDSLVNYSYDRAANNMETCTLNLQSRIKNRLTEDEIAQITAKGYTIA